MYGVLLIHGFAGSREEIRPLGDYLAKRGFSVAMPRLSGHEGTRKELAGANYRDWIEDVKKSYTALAKTCDNIAVVGFSMGGLLAAQLYQTHKFHRFITINTPVYYWDFTQMAKNLRTDFCTYWKQYFSASASKPFRTLLNFQRLLSRTKPLFCTIDCPALVIQVQDDDTVNKRSGDYICHALRGEISYMKPLAGGHILLQSDAFQEVADAVSGFLKNI